MSLNRSFTSLSWLVPAITAGLLLACTPKVEIVAPDKPITINLNVKIEHEILVKVDKELDDLFSDEGLF